MRAKTWVLGASEVAGPACWGFCSGSSAPGCILASCHHIPTPNKGHSVGTALPFEVLAVTKQVLSGEMLMQSLPPSLLSPTWAGSVAWGQICPLCRAVCQPRACRDGDSDTPSLAVMPPLSLLCSQSLGKLLCSLSWISHYLSHSPWSSSISAGGRWGAGMGSQGCVPWGPELVECPGSAGCAVQCWSGTCCLPTVLWGHSRVPSCPLFGSRSSGLSP